MKKIIAYSICIISAYFSSIAVAATCTDLNGIWQGRIDDTDLTLKINLSAFSTIEYRSVGDNGGLVGGIESICELKDGVPNLYIWHQVNNENATDWHVRVIVYGSLNSPNELTINKYQILQHSGTNTKGSGVLIRTKKTDFGSL